MTAPPLRTRDDELRDLAEGSPELFDPTSGAPTGLRVTRLLGAGGMSTVYLATHDKRARSTALLHETPERVALKFLKLSTVRELKRLNVDPLRFLAREEVALRGVMQAKPPTEFVVACYGSGVVDVELVDGPARRLPWLAIEYVDGGTAGVSLTERVAREAEGVDPVRAMKLVSGLFEGVRALHQHGVIHRDLKPDNVLVAGPIDDETPKLADCGIARVQGMGTTLQAATPEYCGPEQALAISGNPLVGPWTDVHALSAVVWFLLTGEQWCTGPSDMAWHQGHRRTLRGAQKLHRGFRASDALASKLDAVLRRGAAQRLPDAAWTAQSRVHEARARTLFPGLLTGEARYAQVAEFESALLPVLHDAVAAWKASAVREKRAFTAFRPTQMLTLEQLLSNELATVREQPASGILGTQTTVSDAATPPLAPGRAVFQPDGRILVRLGSRLVFFVEDVPHKVRVTDAEQPLVDGARQIVRGPGGAGFALVGAQNVTLVRGGRFVPMPHPQAGRPQPSRIACAVGDGRVFGVVTSPTEDGDDPELWLSEDGATWTGPETVALDGEPHAMAYGPFGFLLVGARGSKARALFFGLDGQAVVFSKGVRDRGPLAVALCSADREAWGAGDGYVLRFDRGTATDEAIEVADEPVAFGLDPVGVPWLVTKHAVLRRHVDGGVATWRKYYGRPATGIGLAAIGFTPDGARVLDAACNTIRITPRDVDRWRAVSATELFA